MAMNLEGWPNSPTGEWLSITAAIVIGPIVLFLSYQAGLVFAEGAWMYFLVCTTVVPVLVAFGGRFRLVVWQLAALSLALAVVIDNLRLEANMRTHVKEYPGVAFYFWAAATVLSCPLPIFFLVQSFRERKQRRE